MKLRLLLGQRGAEVIGMRWSEVDFKAKTWDLPGARTKNRHPHTVPLPPTALAIVERRRGEVPMKEPRVFPGLTMWTDDFRVLSEIHAGAYEWKDFRRTVSTRLAAVLRDVGGSPAVERLAGIQAVVIPPERPAAQAQRASCGLPDASLRSVSGMQ